MPISTLMFKSVSLYWLEAIERLKHCTGFFGSDRSSRNADLRPFVRSSVRFNLQIFKQSVGNKSAVSEHLESTQIIQIRVNAVGAYKYLVLFCTIFCTS